MDRQTMEMLEYIFTNDVVNRIKLLYGLEKYNTIRAIISNERDFIDERHMKHYIHIKSMAGRLKMISIMQIFDRLEDMFIEKTEEQFGQ